MLQKVLLIEKKSIKQLLFVALLFVSFLLWHILSPQPLGAITGINEQVNYQARLLTDTGAVVPDGTYNVEFKIYQDGDGCESGGASPCSGTLQWTETRTGTNRVTVKNGYFSVRLGSVTAFGSSVDWNQDTLWLSINIGGTSGTPTWDGEMTPFRRLTSVPYALNAGKLGGLDVDKFLQIAPSAVQVDSGTLDSIYLNKTGASGNILRLQKSGTDMFVMDNDGNVALGAVAPVQKFEVQDGDAAIYNSGNSARLIIGDDATTGQHGFLQWDSTNDYFRIEKTGSNGVKINDNFVSIGNLFPDSPLKVGSGSTLLMSVGTTGAFTSQNSTDSTAAFQVLNAAGDTVLNVDTTNKRVGIGYADPAEALDVNGIVQQTGRTTSNTGAADNNKWTKLGSCTITVQFEGCIATVEILGGRDGSAGNNTQASVALRARQQAALGDPPLINVQLNGVAEVITQSDITTVTTQNDGAATVIELWGRITNTFEAWNFTPSINYGDNGTKWAWFSTDGFSTTLPAGTQTAATYGDSFANTLFIKNTADSTAAFEVQDASSNQIMAVDTSNGKVLVSGNGFNQGGGEILFGDSSLVTIGEYGSGSDTDQLVAYGDQGVRLEVGGGTPLLIDSAGTALFKNVTDASTAFRVQNAAGDTIVQVNTSSGNFTIRASATNYTERLCHDEGNGAVVGLTLGDCQATGQADLAEFYDTDGNVEPGDVVAPNSDGGYSVSKTTESKQSNIIGIASTNPTADGIIGHNVESDTRQPVALAGRVPLKVSLENGPIAIGDHLTASAQFGVAMKAQPGDPTVGIALESYDSSSQPVSNLVTAEEDDRAVVHADDLPEYRSDPSRWPEGVGKVMVFLKLDSGNNLSQTALQQAVFDGGIVAKDTTFNGLVTFNGQVKFSDNATFTENISVNDSTAGMTTLPQNQTSTTVTFAQPHSQTPVINATPDQFISGTFRITNITPSQFTIEVTEEQTKDTTFNWTAFSN